MQKSNKEMCGALIILTIRVTSYDMPVVDMVGDLATKTSHVAQTDKCDCRVLINTG